MPALPPIHDLHDQLFKSIYQLDCERSRNSRSIDRHSRFSCVPIGPGIDLLDFERTPPTQIRVLNNASIHILGSGWTSPHYAAISASRFAHHAFLMLAPTGETTPGSTPLRSGHGSGGLVN